LDEIDDNEKLRSLIFYPIDVIISLWLSILKLNVLLRSSFYILFYYTNISFIINQSITNY